MYGGHRGSLGEKVGPSVAFHPRRGASNKYLRANQLAGSQRRALRVRGGSKVMTEIEALTAANLPASETGEIILRSTAKVLNLSLDHAVLQLRRHVESKNREMLTVICNRNGERINRYDVAAFIRAAWEMPARVN
jgi:hypothetical protein